MLELAILGLLQHQELHGYEIRKRLRDELGFFSNVSFGALYPALSRLERCGALATVEEAAEHEVAAVPMTGSLSGERAAFRSLRAGTSRGRRSRRVYRITDAGRTLFADLLHSDTTAGTDDARGFGLRLAFARHLPPQARLRLFERRRAQVAERLVATRSMPSPSVELDSYVLALLSHTREAAEHEIAWLDGLIGAEQESMRTPGREPVPALIGTGSAGGRPVEAAGAPARRAPVSESSGAGEPVGPEPAIARENETRPRRASGARAAADRRSSRPKRSNPPKGASR